MTLPRSYFDALYAENPDPWGFGSRWYEARKYALTLAVLPLARYRRAFEPGCSIGVLTRSLAGRCDAVVGMDASADALEAAADRVPPNVELVQAVVPQDWPEGTFDLVVLSEVAYYLDDADLDHLVERVTASLEPRGHLIAVHWRPIVPDYPSDGEAVHARLVAHFASLAYYEDEYVLVDVMGDPTAGISPPE
jgi:trans-aconitate methyltransferase